jgi:hypothetical protein
MTNSQSGAARPAAEFVRCRLHPPLNGLSPRPFRVLWAVHDLRHRAHSRGHAPLRRKARPIGRAARGLKDRMSGSIFGRELGSRGYGNARSHQKDGQPAAAVMRSPRAASGNEAAATPSSVINSRRFD